MLRQLSSLGNEFFRGRRAKKSILISSLWKYIGRDDRREGFYEALETNTYHKKADAWRCAWGIGFDSGLGERAAGCQKGCCTGGKKAADLLRADRQATGFRQL